MIAAQIYAAIDAFLFFCNQRVQRCGVSFRFPATDFMSQAQDLARAFSTPARRLNASPDGRYIIDASPLKDESFRLKTQELRLQKYLLDALENAKTFEEACFNAGVTPEWADEYLSSPRYKKWLSDRREEVEINAQLSPALVRTQYWKIFTGELPKDRLQMEALNQLGERIDPKISRNADPAPARIEINISAETLEKSRQRRASLEAQIETTTHG